MRKLPRKRPLRICAGWPRLQASMNTSVSFDRAVGFYDRTRDFPEPVATRGIQAILDAAGQGARLLDVGTGTGRVSVPLLKRGADLVGCDLSLKMMALLRQKFPLARLAQADASRIPFPSGHFDALTTCHVMHLVGPWREALREYRRVLRPGGVYINARTDRVGGSSIRRQVREFWQGRVTAHGFSMVRPGVQDEKELHTELLGMGADLKQVEIVRYLRPYSVREAIEGIANRTHSHSWDTPDDIFERSLRELREWAAHEYPDLDTVFEEEACFALDIACFN
jgi:ubiquinone/menaquinone biosynthesis C-methylase UbiE